MQLPLYKDICACFRIQQFRIQRFHIITLFFNINIQF